MTGRRVGQMKGIRTLIIVLVCIVLFTGTVVAEDVTYTDTYTHWSVSGGERIVANRPLYAVEATLTQRTLGVREDVGEFVDIATDEKGTVYVLTNESRILRFDKAYNLQEDYTVVDETGTSVDFTGAEGLLVLSSRELYIADTKSARVLHCVEGKVTDIYQLPQSDLIPEGFTFQPIGVARDSRDYVYVVSKGSYYGALLYDPAGQFVGFYGANTVSGNVLTALNNLWDMLTQNDEKRSRTKKTLPYDFSDLCIDENDFVYTCTGTNADGNYGQIRMLSPGGTNVLTGSEGKNFGETDVATRLNAPIKQNFCSIDTDGKYIYALDQSYGLLYVYDENGTEICVFGGGRGIGEQEGLFSSACAIELYGDNLLVVDSLKNTVTVFSLTDYGRLVLEAQQKTLQADYLGAKPIWEQVQQADAFNRLALLGLGKAAYASEDYDSAMAYAKAAGDTETYSLALTAVQTAYISENFAWLFVLILLVVGGMMALIIITVKRRVVIIPNVKVRTLFSCITHPFRSFYDIKYKSTGSLILAVVLVALFYLSGVLSVVTSDFRYTSFDATTYNALFQVVQTAGLIILWSVANWAISTLQQGNGKLKEVFLVTAYATLPLILYNIVSTPLSHLLGSADSTLLSGLYILAIIFTGIMLCVGLMTIHDFSFPRLVFTAFLTVVMMILIVFVLFMIGILLSQFFNFFASIITEATQW